MILSKFFFLFIFLTYTAFSFEIPDLSGPVIDQAKFLTLKNSNILADILIRTFQVGGSQFQLLTIDSLNGENIEEVSIKIVDKWQLGDKQKDDGVLVLMSRQERKIRIEVGQGLEGEITDALSGRIIQNATLYFKRNRFDEGIFYIFDKLLELSGKADPKLAKVRKSSTYSSLKDLFFFVIFFLIFLFARIFRGRSGSSSHYQRSHSSGYWGSGGGGFGGGSSGGGWSGGGGGFSGGGSSGSW